MSGAAAAADLSVSESSAHLFLWVPAKSPSEPQLSPTLLIRIRFPQISPELLNPDESDRVQLDRVWTGLIRSKLLIQTSAVWRKNVFKESLKSDFEVWTLSQCFMFLLSADSFRLFLSVWVRPEQNWNKPLLKSSAFLFLRFYFFISPRSLIPLFKEKLASCLLPVFLWGNLKSRTEQAAGGSSWGCFSSVC